MIHCEIKKKREKPVFQNLFQKHTKHNSFVCSQNI